MNYPIDSDKWFESIKCTLQDNNYKTILPFLIGAIYLEDVVNIYVPSTYIVVQLIDNTSFVNQSLKIFPKHYLILLRSFILHL